MRRISLALLATLALPATAFANATFTIVNLDGPTEGFNDPTPATPVGGNSGTTVGAQRLIAFQHAVSIWAGALDSTVEIRVRAAFNPLTCTATQAVLGSAGTINIVGNFPNAPLFNHWYNTSLANKLAGFDLIPADPANGVSGDDINAQFNSNLNGNPACLGGTGWYYGLDANHGPSIDLVTVLLHEFGHGLGFQGFTSLTTGNFLQGFPDTYAHHLFDNQVNLGWEEMTTAQRFASIRNGRHVVWNGAAVTAAVPDFLDFGTPLLRVTSPASIAGTYAVGTASFGPALTTAGVSGEVVVGLDASNVAGPSTTDGCTAFTNAAAVAGKIALVDRGTCGFVVKALNAQVAGARALIVADNAPDSPPPGLGGVDPTIVIPAVRITLADGATLKANPGAVASLLIDLSVRAGADPQGRAMVNATNPIQQGSSISHYDPLAFPNVLMEPAINADLTHDLDLTLPQMRDIGWYPDADLDMNPDTSDACLGSDLRDEVIIESCNSGVANPLFTSGCTITDLTTRCVAGAKNHGQYVSCVSHTLNELKKAGVISGADKGAIQSCAAQSSLP